MMAQQNKNFLPTVAPSNLSSGIGHTGNSAIHGDHDYRLSSSPPDDDFHDPQDDFESGEHKPYIPAGGPVEHASKPGDFEFGVIFGCTPATFEECMRIQLLGLRRKH